MHDSGRGGRPPRDKDIFEQIPDVRDGLTRTERIILTVLNDTRRELNGRDVPTVMLYGRVVEHVNISEQEFQMYLQRLGVRGGR